jgi:nucleoside-diphosphate-sugar epimerase
MNIFITGANGFIGKALAQRIAQLDCWPDGRRIRRLTLLDLEHEDPVDGDSRVHLLSGCVSDPSILDAALSSQPDVVFHLAAVASGRAEDDFELGMSVNLHASLRLLDGLAQQGNCPRVVFSSSIAVYGSPLPATISDDTVIAPSMSYGAQKRAVELILSDYSRRGLLRALAVRLPGIVVRPATDNGALSLFTSRLISGLARGEPVTLPVSGEATVWLMSLPRCLDNLMWAAQFELPAHQCNYAWTLPCMRVSIRDIVAHFSKATAGRAEGLVHYEPQPDIQAMFGHLPPLTSTQAQGLGFQADASLGELIHRSLPHPTITIKTTETP